jgi:hypothetical protein
VKQLSGATFQGRLLASSTIIRLRLLKRLARDKHTSFLRKFVNYGQKKFYNFGLSILCAIQLSLFILFYFNRSNNKLGCSSKLENYALAYCAKARSVAIFVR